jgi:cell fate (sporulation/competence/biofilm development) regulator YmcA (YheA/YmcA/DUF963 family)
LANTDERSHDSDGRPRSEAVTRSESRPHGQNSYKRQRALADLEAAIEAAEARLKELGAARDYQATEEDLARLLEQWTAMEAA